MKRLQITLFVIAFVILGTQSFRHVYVKWIEPRSSVLDSYREPVDTAIASATSLDELLAMYEQADSAVQEYESNPDNPRIPSTRYGGPGRPYGERERLQTEPYASQLKIEQAIWDWERRAKGVFELRFFWGCGLLSILLGVWCHRKWNAWLGMAAIIAGFSEMAYWTSPLARSFGGMPEFERLLTHKLLLSFISWGLLVTLWLLADRWGKRATLTE